MTTYKLLRQLQSTLDRVERAIHEQRFTSDSLARAFNLLAELKRTDDHDEWLIAIKAALAMEHRTALRNRER